MFRYVLLLPVIFLPIYSFLMENKSLKVIIYNKINIIFFLFFVYEIVWFLQSNKISYIIIATFLFSIILSLVQFYKNKKYLYYSNLFLLFLSIIIFILIKQDTVGYDDKYFKFFKIVILILIYFFISIFYFFKILMELLRRYKSG